MEMWRFLRPPSFAAFILSPKANEMMGNSDRDATYAAPWQGDATAARKILGETLGKQAGAMKSSQV